MKLLRRPAPPPRHAVAALPKAERHVHLEGTVDPAVLRRLWLRYRGSAAGAPPARFGPRDLPGFLEHFRRIVDVLEEPADYGLLARLYLRRVARHGVRFVEFTVSLGSALRRGRAARRLLTAIRDAAEGEPVRSGVIVDVVRQFGADEARRALDAALECLDLGIVVGFGMGGDERSIPARRFRGCFETARKAGLRTSVHAGEWGGPEGVREALEELRPDRIAHGIAACQDPGLLDRLAAAGVPLDVCLRSNLATGVVREARAHPLPYLLAAGVRVTLGTDDPALFGTNLTREYLLAARIAGLDLAGLGRLAGESLRDPFAAVPGP